MKYTDFSWLGTASSVLIIKDSKGVGATTLQEAITNSLPSANVRVTTSLQIPPDISTYRAVFILSESLFISRLISQDIASKNTASTLHLRPPRSGNYSEAYEDLLKYTEVLTKEKLATVIVTSPTQDVVNTLKQETK
jgi:hypothetical protein